MPNAVFTRKWHQNDVTGGHDLSKCAGKSYGSTDNFGDLLAYSVQKFWSLIVLPATVVASAGVNIIGVVWIPRDYSAGAGRFLACFHPTGIHKIELLEKYLPDWPQIFRQEAFSGEEHSSNIWLQKTEHVKGNCALLYNSGGSRPRVWGGSQIRGRQKCLHLLKYKRLSATKEVIFCWSKSG